MFEFLPDSTTDYRVSFPLLHYSGKMLIHVFPHVFDPIYFILAGN